MELNDAIKLIQHKHISPATPQTWADLGCGAGLFTQALASLLPGDSLIYAIDKNTKGFKKFSSPVTIHVIQLDFIKEEINLSNLNGVLMANSLHYVKDKISFLDKLKNLLKNDGCLLIVEYDTDKSNPWVPYPLSFSSLEKLCKKIKHRSITKLQEHPSVFGRANMYAALIEFAQ